MGSDYPCIQTYIAENCFYFDFTVYFFLLQKQKLPEEREILLVVVV